ncbi:MAG TPA: hypothetical protein VGL74_11740 [Terriglobales bacterium]|jgi:hypothetical protein
MIDLKSMAVTMPEVAGHPNRMAFHGVLTMVDVSSDRAPSGAKGHLVMLTRKAAEAALPSLLGMALDYSPAWDRHDVRRKVGVITRADIVGRKVEVGGYLYARDFPEIVEEIAKSGRRTNYRAVEARCGLSRSVYAGSGGAEGWIEGHRLRRSLRNAASEIFGLKGMIGRRIGPRIGGPEISRPTIRAEACPANPGLAGLGLSYEVTDVQLADERSQVWTLEKVTFTGAAILRRDKAAYRDTWIGLGTHS